MSSAARLTALILSAAATVAVPAQPAPSAGGSAARADTTEIRAQLSPRRYTTLAAEIGARVQRLTVTDGSAFRAGQVLVSFDCALQQAQLDRARAAHDAAAKVRDTNKRLEELNAVGRLELDQSEGELAKARAEMQQIQVMLGKCQIVAPWNGRVADQRIREGQYAQAGQALLDVHDDSVLELEFIMPSRWLQKVRVGSGLQIAVDETGKSYPAKVLRLGGRVDPVSQSVKVVAAITGRPQELMAGMSGRVTLDLAP